MFFRVILAISVVIPVISVVIPVISVAIPVISVIPANRVTPFSSLLKKWVREYKCL